MNKLFLLIFIGFLSGPGIVHAQSAYDDIQSAVKNGNAALIRQLLAKGVDVDSTDREGTTLLITAASEGKLESVRALVDGRAKLNTANQFGETALMMASIRGHRPVVEYLLGKGAQVNQPGWTALMFAAIKGHADIVKMLLSKGANVNASSQNGTTALMLAAKEGNLDTVLVLLDHGASVNLRNMAGMTALGVALESKRRDVAGVLLKAGAEQ